MKTFHLQFISPSGIMVSTVKVPLCSHYETMIFNEKGEPIFTRRYANKIEAYKGHCYYIKQNDH